MKRRTESMTVKFTKVQPRCKCGCSSSLHVVAQMVGEHCIGCKTCTGWELVKP